MELQRLTEELLLTVTSLNRSCIPQSVQEHLKGENFLLSYLDEHGGCSTPGVLREVLGVSAPRTAAMLRALEEKGIGRPSTYAPTISTILSRNYVVKEGRYLRPTNLGIVVTEMMEEYFRNIVDLKFTANMETDLDKIEAGIQNAGAVSRLLAAGMDGQVVLETVLHGFDLEILETQPVEYRCYCSRDRVTRTLISLGRKELQSIVDDGKDIHIDCQFCDKIYDYTPEQVRQILKELDE